MENHLEESNTCVESNFVEDISDLKCSNNEKLNDLARLSSNNICEDLAQNCEDELQSNILINDPIEKNHELVEEEPSKMDNGKCHRASSKSPLSIPTPNEENSIPDKTGSTQNDRQLAMDTADVISLTDNADRLLGDDNSNEETTNTFKNVECSSNQEENSSQPSKDSVIANNGPTDNVSDAEQTSKISSNSCELVNIESSKENSMVTTNSSAVVLQEDVMDVDENSSMSSVSHQPISSPVEPMDTLDSELERNDENSRSTDDVNDENAELSSTKLDAIENDTNFSEDNEIAPVDENSTDSASKIAIESVNSESSPTNEVTLIESHQNDDPKDVNFCSSSEVCNVDVNEDHLEPASDSLEKDPFAQETENSASQIEINDKNDTETEKNDSDTSENHQSSTVEKSKQPAEFTDLSDSTACETLRSDGDENDEELPSIQSDGPDASSSKISKTSTSDSEKTTVVDKNSSEKEGEEGPCIIPDVSENSVKKLKAAIHKQVRKFDITPVRLEKLMDPNKLAAVKLEADSNKSSLISGRPQRQAAKKAETQIKEIVSSQTDGEPEENDQSAVCIRCSRLRVCRFMASAGGFVCLESCYQVLMEKKLPAPVRIISAVKNQPIVTTVSRQTKIVNSEQYSRKCAFCGVCNICDDKSLSWEAMDFCNEDCINRYQVQHGSYCAYCNCAVQHVSMGKYAVRFGLEARQFCSGVCLEDFKKGLKSCSYCQLDITNSTSSVCVSVGEKQTSLKEFCSQSCVEKYELMSSGSSVPPAYDLCTVCANKKSVEIQVTFNSRIHLLCSDACFRAFKFANNINETNQCAICKKFYPQNHQDSYLVHHDDTSQHFCSKICMNVFILFKRKIVPCSWCKVKKYNFDMIKKTVSTGGCVMMCSLNCLTLYQVSVNASSTRKIKCDLCANIAHAQYHLTMSDATIRNFCSYSCVMVFQTQYNKAPLTLHEQNKSNLLSVPVPGVNAIPQKPAGAIANGLLSSASTTIKISSPLTVASGSTTNLPTVISTSSGMQLQKQTKYVQQIIVKPPEPKDCANKFTQCKPNTSTKGVSCRPAMNSKECQTEELWKHPAVLPIPVPIYVPVPMHMYTTPFPVPLPFALPIPVPIFIPTTQKTFKGVMSRMKEIMEKIPSNPYEADLLLMAKMVAGEEKAENVDNVTKNNDSDDDDAPFADAAAADSSDGEHFSETENTVTNNFNDEMLQTVMKIASEQLNNTPSVDLEAELTSNTITPQTQVEENGPQSETPEVPAEKPKTRKRPQRSGADAPSRKKTRSQPVAVVEAEKTPAIIHTPTSVDTPPPPSAEGERPDSSMCLKYTIGVRAWKQWVISKNEQIEQAAASANKKAKLFNTNILKLTTDELNYLLCLFVKEVRKPNGVEYAPDTIYYLCLSIQQYMFENGRIDNIFSDSFYEPFTDVLNEIALKFADINDTTQYVVTRVEEEHLWESKQLGAHSPHVLLATLMFFNTKYFNLATLEEHMQLSFSHIMKHWKRNINPAVGKPGSPASNRNVVLRFYPPQAALDAPNSRKKKVYEQHENEVNPLRCPVKLYEFYLSKCPESVKQRNDVFYLQPERSCVPDSPVWYSTMPLQKNLLQKMLHRIRMVKEVNISLLAS